MKHSESAFSQFCRKHKISCSPTTKFKHSTRKSFSRSEVKKVTRIEITEYDF